MSNEDFLTATRGRNSRQRFALAVCVLSVCGFIAAGVLRLAPRDHGSSPEPAPAEDRKAFRPEGVPDRPQIEVTADHQVKRVKHKDQSGYSPLEIVQTPEGAVTIQRTFSTDGRLLKEEAFLNGKSVPVPRD